MIFAIIYITQKFGRNAGILSALIMVLNLYNAEKNLTEGHHGDGVHEGFREAQTEEAPTKKAPTKEEVSAKRTERVKELANQEPSPTLQSYVDGGDQDGLPDPATWMSKESLAKFKAYIKKISCLLYTSPSPRD